MESERRRFTRIPFKVKAELTANDVLYSADEIRNLSVGGCLIPILADLKSGTVCNIRILLSGTNSELSIRIDGEIIRKVPEAVAVKFIGIDHDSLFHLQNIVRYNATDPDIVEQEILDHPGLV